MPSIRQSTKFACDGSGSTNGMRCQRPSELFALRHQQLDALSQEIGVFKRGEHRRLRRDVQIIRLLDLQYDLGDGRREDAVADAQPGEPGPLAEGAQDDQVRALRDATDVAAAGELDVRFVEDDDEARRQESVQLSFGDHVPCRIVRRGDEDDLCLACHRPYRRQVE